MKNDKIDKIIYTITMVNSEIINLDDICKKYNIKKIDIKNYGIKYGQLHLYLKNDEKITIDIISNNIEDIVFEDISNSKHSRLLNKKGYEKHNINDIKTIQCQYFIYSLFDINEICKEYGIKKEDITNYYLKDNNLILEIKNSKILEIINENLEQFDFKYFDILYENNIKINLDIK